MFTDFRGRDVRVALYRVFDCIYDVCVCVCVGPAVDNELAAIHVLFCPTLYAVSN
jgi:hypothetical protein